MIWFWTPVIFLWYPLSGQSLSRNPSSSHLVRYLYIYSIYLSMYLTTYLSIQSIFLCIYPSIFLRISSIITLPCPGPTGHKGRCRKGNALCIFLEKLWSPSLNSLLLFLVYVIDWITVGKVRRSFFEVCPKMSMDERVDEMKTSFGGNIGDKSNLWCVP